MKDFVPYYDEALAVKELGFDEFCFATIDQTDYVHIKGTKKPPRGSMVYDTIDCPTFSQAFRFFREKIVFRLSEFKDKQGKRFSVVTINDANFKEEYSTYEQAELECLRKLIEICKSK